MTNKPNDGVATNGSPQCSHKASKCKINSNRKRHWLFIHHRITLTTLYSIDLVPPMSKFITLFPIHCVLDVVVMRRVL